MLKQLLSLLFPPSPEEELLSELSHLKPLPHTLISPKGLRVLTLSRYDEPDAHAAITLLKRSGNPIATKLLAQLLHDVLLEELSTTQLWNSRTSNIVLIPSTIKRNRERGFNPCALVCKRLPRELRARVTDGVLQQIKSIPMQKTLTRAERFTNVTGVFAVTDLTAVRDQHIILLDDVYTTGATLDEAAQTLIQAGAHVTAVALVRA